MPNVQALEIKKLRQQTGAGFMDCKEALKASGNNFDKALEWLKKKGISTAAKKSTRTASEGLVVSYIHGKGRIGVLLEVNSETDFVARNEQFKAFAKELSLHIAAMRPLYISETDIPENTKAKEREIFKEQALEKGKTGSIADKIAEGLYNKWLEEVCLLKQEFIRQETSNKQNVQSALNDLIARIGENIIIRRFVRFSLGEAPQKSGLDHPPENKEEK